MEPGARVRKTPSLLGTAVPALAQTLQAQQAAPSCKEGRRLANQVRCLPTRALPSAAQVSTTRYATDGAQWTHRAHCQAGVLRGELARALQAAAVKHQALRGVHVAGRAEFALDQRQQLRVLLRLFDGERWPRT